MRKFVSSQSVVAVAVDTQTPRLYWSEFDGPIFSVDYNGNGRRMVISSHTSTGSLGVSGNRLFWSSPPNSENIRTLWNCLVSVETGICSSAQRIPFYDPKAIEVYTDQPSYIRNPCESSPCQHLCLLKANDGHSCACYVGYQLQSDSRGCEPVNEYVLYARGNFLRGRILDVNKEAFTQAISPVRLHRNLVLDTKSTVEFDYNCHTNTVAFTDDQSISTVNLGKENEHGEYQRGRCLRGVAFDWITNDIYYLSENCDNRGNTSVVLMKPKEDKYFWRTLRSFKRSSGSLRSLALHPNSGIYFFSVLHKTEPPKIYKMNGSGKLSAMEFDANETGLAIDYNEDRIYWFSQNTTLLHHANFEGKDMRTLNITMVREPRSIAVHGRYVYVSNLTSIWRMDKVTGRGALRIVPADGDPIAGVKVFSRELQTIKSGVPCASDNGCCEQFCLRVPRQVVSGANTVEATGDLQEKCLCEDYKIISRYDGKSCVSPENPS